MHALSGRKAEAGDARELVVADTETAFARDGVAMLVLETALPAKFADTIREALGIEPPRPAALQGIEQLPKRFQVMPVDAERVKTYIREHT